MSAPQQNRLARISAANIQIDKALPWDVYDANGKLLLQKGYVITRDAQIENLIERGMFVDAELLKRSAPPVVARAKFNPFTLWDDIHKRLNYLLRHAKEEADLGEKFTSVAMLLRILVEKDADAGLSVMLMADGSRYAVAHSLHAAIVCDLVAQRLKWDAEKRISLICAALTMNIGMVELQTQLVIQRTPLTDEQQSAIHLHPHVGASILMAGGVTDEAWLTAVRQHHESPDGSGYPDHLTEIGQMALLIRLADIFCAKVSPRSYRKPIPANEAAKILFLSHVSGAGAAIAPLLIKEIGIYPPGSYVKLANGETGVVIRRGEVATSPLVYSILNSQGQPVIDPLRRETSKPGQEIVAVLPRDKILVRINMSSLWGYE